MALRDTERNTRYLSHYYGNVVRRLFLAGGIIMLLSLAIYKHLLPMPTFFSVFIILVIGVVAGLTNPLKTWATTLNVVVSAVSFVVFEYHAVTYYENVRDPLFFITQLLALIFFVALYYSTKTLRAGLIKNES